MPIPSGTVWLSFFDTDGLDNQIGTPGAETAVLVGSELIDGKIVHNATTDRTELAADSDDLFVNASTSATIAFGYRKTDTTNRGSGAIGNNGAETSRLGTHLPFSDGKVYWDFGGATEGASRLSIAGLDTQGYHVWTFTAGSRGMEIWQDGVLKASNAATPSWVATTNAYSLGIHDGSASDLAEYSWLFINNTQLSAADITDMANNPEVFFAESPASSITITNYPGWIGMIRR